MLRLIRKTDQYFQFSQRIIKGNKRVNEVLKNLEMVFQQPAACDASGCCGLALYRCPRSLKKNYCRAGILCCAGPAYEGAWDDFPTEMIEFFSDKEKICFYLADEYYKYLVRAHAFSIEVGAAY